MSFKKSPPIQPPQKRYKVSTHLSVWVMWFDEEDAARSYYRDLHPTATEVIRGEKIYGAGRAVLWDTSTQPWTRLAINF
jgi:hypothetical protein